MQVFKLSTYPEAYWRILLVNQDSGAFDAPYGASLKDDWHPIPIKLVQAEYNGKALRPADCPDFLPRHPILSARAISGLSDLIDGKAEVLPLSCKGHQFFYLNIIRLVDALDSASATFRVVLEHVVDVLQYEFFPEKIAEETIFKIPDISWSEILVTDTFVERVKETNLTGFRFLKVWDSQTGGVLRR